VWVLGFSVLVLGVGFGVGIKTSGYRGWGLGAGFKV